MSELGRGGTLVSRVARQLSAFSMAVPDGAFIGAEDDLLGRLGISRPTLRQAAKIAESEGMISVRRGIRGGFYAARPRVADAIRALNRYLRLQGATIRDLGVTNSVVLEAARAAATCTDAAQRDALAALVDEARAIHTAKGMIDIDTRFARTLAAMSGNPVIEVMIAMSYSFGLEEQGVYLYDEEEHRELARGWFAAIADAVLAGDGELALFMMQRRLTAVLEWIDLADDTRLGPVGEL